MRDAEKDLAMCEAATPGPWRNDHDQVTKENGFPLFKAFRMRGDLQMRDDARFITEAREALPYWIKRATAAKAEVDQLRKEHLIDRIKLNRRIMKLETENTRMVVLAGAGYEKLVKALQTIVEETYDLGARECAAKALKSIEVS